MKRALIFALLVCLPASAAVTFTAKLQTINGAPSNQFLHLELKGCARYFTTNGTAVITKALDLYPDAQGNISASVQDSQLLTCGTVTGAAYYGVSTCQAGRKCPAEAVYAADYDVTGATFNLNSASPKSGTPPTVFNGNATQLQGRNVSNAAPNNGDVWVWNSSTSKWEPIAPGAASVPDATTLAKGKIQLAGDLGGTADAPTVPGLAAKANTSSLATVATTGAYTDLTGEPTAPQGITCNSTDKISAFNATTGAFTCTADQAGAGGGTWGTILGSIIDQTDLNDALNSKSPSDHTHPGVYEPIDANITRLGSSISASEVAADVATQAELDAHNHTGVYEPANANITKLGATIGASEVDADLATQAELDAKITPQNTTCSGTDKVSAYNATTGALTCTADQEGAAGGGITSLGASAQGQTGSTQTLATSNDTNVTLSVGSATNTHTFTAGWQGTLSKARGGAGADMSSVTFPSSGTIATTASNVASATTLSTGADRTKLDGIAVGAEVNVNADWNSASGDSQILNKPTLGTSAAKNIPASGNASATEVVYGTDTRLTDSRTPTAESMASTGLSDFAAKSGSGTTILGTTITTPADNDLLMYSSGNWVNGSVRQTVYTHATDCTAVTTGVAGDLCTELDSERLFSCQPTAGGCDTGAEWILTGDGTGAGGGAPTDATYITQTAHTSLSAEQALSALTTGIVKVTNGTGVLSTAVDADFPSTLARDSEIPVVPSNTTATANQFFTAYNNTTGAFTKAQPLFSDISGSATDAQVPNNITIDLAAAATALGTGADRTKLDGIAAGAEVNVNADWNSATGDSQILNKPTLAANTTATASQFFTAYNSTTGAFTKAGIAAGDLPTGFVDAVGDVATGLCAANQVLKKNAGNTAWECSADASSATSQPWEAGFYYGGIPSSNYVFLARLIPTFSPAATITIPSNCSGSALVATSAATGESTITIKKNSTTICTATVAAAGTTATFTGTGGTLTTADKLTIQMGTADATFGGITLSVAGSWQ
jgi:hypothetical protein